MIKGIIVFILLSIDQILKYLANLSLQGKSIVVISNVLEFVFVKNTGGAWGILADYPVLFIVFIPAIVISIIILTKKVTNNIENIGWAMIIGGAIGNYIDRIARGYVVDFINIYILPVFNFADMCIVIGCVFVIAVQIFGKGERRSD